MLFIEQKDINYLEEKGIDFNKDYPVFLYELYLFLKKRWHEKYHPDLIPLMKGDIDKFNQIIQYPSTGAYHILDDSFTACENEINIMSSTSKALFGYFYGIYLR